MGIAELEGTSVAGMASVNVVEAGATLVVVDGTIEVGDIEKVVAGMVTVKVTCDTETVGRITEKFAVEDTVSPVWSLLKGMTYALASVKTKKRATRKAGMSRS